MSPSRVLDERSNLTRIYFRAADEAFSSSQRRLSCKLPLQHIRSLPQLYNALHHKFSQLRTNDSFQPNAEPDSVKLVVEYRDSHSQLTRVTQEMNLKDLALVKALYVTVHPASSRTGTAFDASIDACSLNESIQIADDAPAHDDDDSSSLVSDAASSVLVDHSLAGCCGIKSTSGGLVITSYTTPASSDRQQRRRAKCTSASTSISESPSRASTGSSC